MFWLRDFVSNLLANWAVAELLSPTNMITVAIFAALGAAWLYRWHRRQRAEGRLGVQAQHLLIVGVLGTWVFMTGTLGAVVWMLWNGQGLTINSSNQDVFAKLSISDFKPVGPGYDDTTKKLALTYSATLENTSDEVIYCQSRSGGVQIQGRVNQDENPVSAIITLSPRQKRPFVFATIEGIDVSDPKTRIPGKIKLQMIYGTNKDQMNYTMTYEGRNPACS